MNQIIKDVIVQACEELKCSYEDNAAWFLIMIHDCILTMKSSRAIDPNKKTKVEVYDNKVSLPPDCYKVLYVNTLSTMDPETMLVPNIEYVEQGNLLILADDLEIADGGELYLQYKGARTDSEGTPIVDRRFVRMLVAYIGWKYCRQNFDKFPAGIMESYHNEFKAQKLSNL
jgi:hypothetical protein